MRIFILIFFTIANLYATLPNTQIVKNQQIQTLDDFEGEFEISDKNHAKEIDPLYGYNKIMTNINDKFYIHILNPVAKTYKAVLPKPIRTGIDNFLDNLMFPMRLLNNLLQFKFKNSYLETQRFLLNSTIGIAGFIDVANDNFHIKQHSEDFGQTLGYYGVGSGFYVVLPLLGPSNLRDSVGIVADSIMNPMTYMENRGYNLFDNSTEALGVSVEKTINYNSLHVGEYEKLKKDAIDLYPFLKNIYEQRRKKEISE